MHFSLDGIVGASVNCFDLNLNLTRATKDLIELSEKVGMNRITESNIDEWRYRLAVLTELQKNRKRIGINSEALEKHIGLLTTAKNIDRSIWLADIQSGSRNLEKRISIG